MNRDTQKIIFWLSFLPSLCMFILYASIKPDQLPVLPSMQCGVVESYQQHKNRSGPFERVVIRFDNAAYTRHLLFESHLEKVKQGKRVCFEYLDRFKYPNLSESKLLKWIDTHEIQNSLPANQIK